MVRPVAWWLNNSVMPRAGTAQEKSPVHPPSVSLLVGVLDRLVGLLGRHASAGDFSRDVIDHAPDRRAEALIIEVLVIVGPGQVLRDRSHQRTCEPLIGALEDRNQKVAGGEALLDVARDEVFQERAGRLRILEAKKAVLEWLDIDELLE